VFETAVFTVAPGFSAIPSLALASDLKWPKYGLGIVVGGVVQIVGVFMGKI
jgi:hypothetical protein